VRASLDAPLPTLPVAHAALCPPLALLRLLLLLLSATRRGRGTRPTAATSTSAASRSRSPTTATCCGASLHSSSSPTTRMPRLRSPNNPTLA